MGKWASQKKGSSAALLGFLSPMAASDFVVSALTGTTLTVTRTPAIPAGADRWQVLMVRISDGTIFANTFNTGPGLNITGLNAGTAYRMYAAWYSTAIGSRVSDFSPAQAVTTP